MPSLLLYPRASFLLVAEEAQIEEAVRQLVRIGLDDVEVWIPVSEAAAAGQWTSVVPRITTADFAKVLADDDRALVLDVRGADEFAAGHVEGAINIAHTRLAERLGEIPDHSPVYVHCASGLRAALAVSFLAGKGLDVVHVDGGYEEIGV